MMEIRYSVGNLIPGQILGRNLISHWSALDNEILDVVWEGSLKSHFQRNKNCLDFGLQFGVLLNFEMVSKVTWLTLGVPGVPTGDIGRRSGFFCDF